MYIHPENQDRYLPWADRVFRVDPYPWYDILRTEKPVYLMDNGEYVLTRYEDVLKWLKHPLGTMHPGQGPWHAFDNTVLNRDGAEHLKLRRHSNKWFTPKLVNQFAQRTAALANEALDKYSDGSVLDAFHELGVVPTHSTMCEVLGVPDDDAGLIYRHFLTCTDALSPDIGKEDQDKAQSSFDYLFERCDYFFKFKRENPNAWPKGLVDDLIELIDQGELEYRSALETTVLFYGSGSPNPAQVLASILNHMAREQWIWETYRDEPDQRIAIINEFLRLYPAEMSLVRFVSEEVEVGDFTVAKGSPLRLMVGAANRDPAMFTNPHQFDHKRPPEATMHLSFGIGPHACAGQLISRTQIKTILDAIATKATRIEIGGEAALAHTDRVRGYLSLPLKVY